MSFSEVCAWVWPPQFVPCSQTSGHEEGCQDTGVCCFRLFLLLNLTLNSDPANASLSIPLHPPHLFISLGNVLTAALWCWIPRGWAFGWGIPEVGSGWFCPHLLVHSWLPTRDRDSSRVLVLIFSLLIARGGGEVLALGQLRLGAGPS